MGFEAVEDKVTSVEVASGKGFEDFGGGLLGLGLGFAIGLSVPQVISKNYQNR
jgi:hypothetical protein